MEINIIIIFFACELCNAGFRTFHHKSRLKIRVGFAGIEGVVPCYENAAQEVLFTPRRKQWVIGLEDAAESSWFLTTGLSKTITGRPSSCCNT